MINRIVFVLALLGMILALHLWIQKERNFDRGCWGIGQATAVTEESVGCRSDQLEKVSKFLGIPIAALGYGFYFFIGAMAFAKMVLPDRAARMCHSASDIAVAMSLPYTLYLIYYQVLVAKAFCPLCLFSAAIIISLFTLHAVQWSRGGFVPLPSARRPNEIGYAVGMGFVAMGSLAAILIFLNGIGTRGIEGTDAKRFVGMVGQALPEFIDVAKLNELKPARFNHAVASLTPDEWITADTPVLGRSGEISVIVFLDPNCPSCRETFSTINALAKRYGEIAGFYIVSRVLWDYSLLQTQALELAKPMGKYFELWSLQLQRQKRGGLNFAEIESLFRELNLDTINLAARLDAVRPIAMALREQARSAGIDSTPSIYINGIAVDNRSRDPLSLGKLIEQAMRFEAAKSLSE